MMVELLYGLHQRFRYRYRDITVRGHVAAPTPVRRAVWRLNGGAPTSFYVEHVPNAGVDWRFAYKSGPARLRLLHPDVHDAAVERGLARFSAASFALFQHTGASTEWRKVRLERLGSGR